MQGIEYSGDPDAKHRRAFKQEGIFVARKGFQLLCVFPYMFPVLLLQAAGIEDVESVLVEFAAQMAHIYALYRCGILASGRNAAHAPHCANMVPAMFEGLPSPFDHVPVTGAIDNPGGPDSAAATLGFANQTIYPVAGHQHLSHIYIIEHPDPGLGYEAVQDIFRCFGIHYGMRSVAHYHAHFPKAPADLHSETGKGGHDAAVRCRSFVVDHRQDKPSGPESSEEPVLFQQYHAGSAAGSRNRGSHSRRPSANDSDVSRRNQRNPSGGFLYISLGRNLDFHCLAFGKSISFFSGCRDSLCCESRGSECQCACFQKIPSVHSMK